MLVVIIFFLLFFARTLHPQANYILVFVGILALWVGSGLSVWVLAVTSLTLWVLVEWCSAQLPSIIVGCQIGQMRFLLVRA